MFGPECNTEWELIVHPAEPTVLVGQRFVPERVELARDCGSQVIPDRELRWVSADPSVAVVSVDSTAITGVSPGATFVEARYAASPHVVYGRQVLLTVHERQ